MPGVFLSYRRSDSGVWTRRVHERLALRFGESLVWRDEDDIRLGKDYLSQIRTAIERADAVLVMIGPQWLARTRGRTRLGSRSDVLRREIEWALAGRASVIPVVVGGGAMPRTTDLPASISALPDQEAQFLRADHWDSDCSALLEGLRAIVSRRRRPEPLRNLHQKLIDRESRYFELLPHEPRQALELATATLRLLDEQAPSYPQDAFLQICRGYAHKNVAMALRDTRQQRRIVGDARAALDRARQVFDAIRVEAEERTAEAYNGLGSIEALREHWPQALAWIDRALALVPNYPAALSDREQVVSRMRA
jgi:tetratricopeptide (TPR) repeat protein